MNRFAVLLMLALPQAANASPHGSRDAVALAELKSGRPIDFNALADQVQTTAVDFEELRAKLKLKKAEELTVSRAIVLPQNKAAIAFSVCAKAACRGFWAVLEDLSAGVRVIAKHELPPNEKAWAVDGFAFHVGAAIKWGSVAAAVLRYDLTEQPRPALGSMFHEYVTIINAQTGKLLFHHELRRAGGDSEKSCAYDIVPANHKGSRQLVVSGRCGVRHCIEAETPDPGCGKPTQTEERFSVRQ